MAFKITDHRKTTVEFDVAETLLTRPPWSLTRLAADIAKASAAGVGSSTNVMLLPAGAWCLKPYQYRYWTEKTITLSGAIRLADWNVAGHIQESPTWKAPTLSGVTFSADVETEDSDHFLTKRVAAGDSYEQTLEEDATAWPSPTLASQDVPMDRVASTKTVYEENQAFMVRFHVPAAAHRGPDNLLNIHFGGDADVPATTSAARNGAAAAAPAPTGAQKMGKGGAFCMALSGSGLASLYELVTGDWKHVTEFRWAAANKVAGAFHTLIVKPFTNKHVSVLAAQTDTPQRAGSLMAAPSPAPLPAAPSVITVTHSRKVTGQPKKKHMVGPGPIRIDMRRDLKIPFQVQLLKYPEEGKVIDHAFVVSSFLPADLDISIKPTTTTPAGTSITWVVKRADTREDVSLKTVAGVSQYYVEFTLTGTGSNTPFLHSYEVTIAGAKEPSALTPWGGGNIKSVNITGPSLDPTHESASVRIEDVRHELTPLLGRARILTRISTQYDPDDPTKKSVLGYFELARARSKKKGKTRNAGGMGAGSPVAFPHEQWREFECNFVSMATRLSDKISFMQKNFAEDESAGIDPETGAYYPWRVTDAIHYLFTECGYGEDELDIPRLPIRLFMSGGDSKEFLIQPTMPILAFIQKLARDYLGGWIVFDGNAGTRGMWRLKVPPQAPYTPVWNFYTMPPETKLPAINCYGANTAFIQHYETYVKPPENNFVCVTAVGEILPNGGGPTLLTNFAWNGRSYNFDPANPSAFPTLPGGEVNPDYLGRFVPLIYFDAALAQGLDPQKGQAAVDWITRRLYEQTCTAQKWINFRAPLIFFTDSADTKQSKPRKLLPYDCVTVNGQTVLVRAANVDYESDSVQMMDVEGMVITTA